MNSWCKIQFQNSSAAQLSLPFLPDPGFDPLVIGRAGTIKGNLCYSGSFRQAHRLVGTRIGHRGIVNGSPGKGCPPQILLVAVGIILGLQPVSGVTLQLAPVNQSLPDGIYPGGIIGPSVLHDIKGCQSGPMRARHAGTTHGSIVGILITGVYTHPRKDQVNGFTSRGNRIRRGHTLAVIAEGGPGIIRTIGGGSPQTSGKTIRIGHGRDGHRLGIGSRNIIVVSSEFAVSAIDIDFAVPGSNHHHDTGVHTILNSRAIRCASPRATQTHIHHFNVGRPGQYPVEPRDNITRIARS